MRTLIFATAFLFATWLSAQRTTEVDLRVMQKGINLNSQIMKTEIQVRKTDRATLYLGGYNMRVYYSSEKLDLIEDRVKSLLSTSKFTDINIDNHLRDSNVSGIGKIPFAANVSFVSFSSNLKDLSKEGQELASPDEWTAIASLEFKIKEPFLNEEVITLAREDRTDRVATAFIEMTEWKGPNVIKPLSVNEYSEDIKGFDLASQEFLNITVGPNPASNDLNIEFSREITDNNHQVLVRDVSGVLVMNQKIDKGSKNVILDIKSLASANYLVEVLDDNEILKTKKIIKVN